MNKYCRRKCILLDTSPTKFPKSTNLRGLFFFLFLKCKRSGRMNRNRGELKTPKNHKILGSCCIYASKTIPLGMHVLQCLFLCLLLLFFEECFCFFVCFNFVYDAFFCYRIACCYGIDVFGVLIERIA